MDQKGSKKRAHAEQTPTPLRMMADPTLWHVIPSRANRKKDNEEIKLASAKKKKFVLEEEEYIEALGKVIERDYFPDLDKYRTHLEYLKALDSKDFDKAERLKYHLLVIQNAETPGATPAVTPAYPAGATPRSENDPYNGGIRESLEDDKSSFIVHDVDNKEVKLPSNITIGELTRLITSEDNENYREKQEQEQQLMRKKLWWLFDGNDPDKKAKYALLDQEELKLLANESERHSWPHRSQNGLMFTPSLEDTYDTCGAKLLKDTEMPPPRRLVVVPKNTRIRTYTAPIASAEMPPKAVNPTQELVSTPAPEPGRDFTPMMTWGDISSTPLSLGSAVVPIDMPVTPLPQLNKREAVADIVYKKMKQTHNTSRVKGVSGGNPAMSPAAQRLQQRLKGKVSGADLMLRKAYTPITGTPSIMQGNTPGLTPGMKKVGFMSTPSGVKTDKKVVIDGGIKSAKKSVTDNLL